MSNTLQLGLAVAGGLVLAAVVAHSAWQSRKNQPRQPEPAPGGTSAAAPAGTESGRVEPTLDDPLGGGLVGLAPHEERKAGLDPLIDVIATLALDTPVSGDAVLAALPATRRVGTKPFSVEGQPPGRGDFEPPVPGARYGALQAGVQLANRAGALNEIEYSEFVVKTQALADQLGATPDYPDMLNQVARARELDLFASTHDAQLSFTLRASASAWSPGYVQQHAQRLGFTPGSIPGRLVLPSAQPLAPPILTLSFDPQAALAEDPEHQALREIQLTLDVAHVERGERAFERLREVADALAAAMDGTVTDDNGHPLRPEAMDAVGQDLEKLYDALESREIAAGSALARRLFS
ncbi:MAG TPA: cell division protein ZipA C-terminal FtsZ-binding domain-containing protein [Burkholderiaceae bacterium]|jgi:hypothetical protein|nr:cell division protein ZipA C-terminal FtsZ-binding domain-containing protein [Burkholderiaceae bacterium]